MQLQQKQLKFQPPNIISQQNFQRLMQDFQDFQHSNSSHKAKFLNTLIPTTYPATLQLISSNPPSSNNTLILAIYPATIQPKPSKPVYAKINQNTQCYNIYITILNNNHYNSTLQLQTQQFVIVDIYSFIVMLTIMLM